MEPLTQDRLEQDPVVQALARRGSVRRYTGQPLPEAVVQGLVAAAQRAPTDASGQFYTFVRIRDRALRDRLAEDCGGQDHVREASEFFVVCADLRRTRLLLEHRGEAFGHWPLVGLMFAVTDASLAAQSMALSAESLGLGICYIGGLQNRVLEVSELLGLPEGVLPLWGLCVGVPDREPRVKPRLPRELVLHEDRYQDPTPDQLDAAYQTMASATRSGDWLNVLRKYFAVDGDMERREPTFRALLERQGFLP